MVVMREHGAVVAVVAEKKLNGWSTSG